MKTIKALCEKFSKGFYYTAYLDELESYRGYYRICVTDEANKVSSWYIFRSCKEFADWCKEIVLC